MDIQTLSTELEQRNIVLTVNEHSKFSYAAPEGALTPDLIEAIREHKVALLLMLSPITEQVEQVHQGNGHHATSAPVEDTSVSGSEVRPPLVCRKCHSTNASDFRMNLARNRWVCCNCGELAPYVHSLPVLPEPANPGEELTTLRREIGQAVREEEAQWVLSDELDPRWPPSLGIKKRLYRQDIKQEVATSGRAEPDERNTDEIEAVKPQTERKPWVTIYADIRAGRAITEQGVTLTFAPDLSLSAFLAEVSKTTEVNRVFLCGARPGETAEAFLNWLADGDMMELYSTEKRGHYFDIERPDASVARYQHRSTKKKIDIRRITAWLGNDRDSQDEQTYTIEDARAAIEITTRYLRQHFPFFRHISGTPSTTFKGLWTEGNRIAGKKFEPLSDEIRALIHGNAGQGRIEFFSEHSAGKLPGLYYYDGIFTYAALAWGMPTEVAIHDTVNEYAGKVPGRYRIKYTVPASWQHVGLFMTKREQGGWFYPGASEAGNTYETWTDGAELDVAYNLPQGMPAWDITILERIVFKSESESSETKPLETITKKIIAIREQIDTDKRQDAKRVTAYNLARGAVRNILLHGIGSFNRDKKTRSYILLNTEDAPAGFNRTSNYKELDAQRSLYTLVEEDVDESMMFPQWAALIWARCRARMTRAALSRPYADIIAIRTDAIAVTRPVASWEANTKVGQLRRKWAIEKTFNAPGTTEKLDDLQRKVTGR